MLVLRAGITDRDFGVRTEPDACPGRPDRREPALSAELPTQTDTEWGRIWDALPPSFPVPEGSVPTETGEGPVSATFAVGASAEQAAEFVMAGLVRGRYTIEGRSNPSEDGSVVIDAVGAAPDCRVQVRLDAAVRNDSHGRHVRGGLPV